MGEVITPDRAGQPLLKHVQVREYVRGLIDGAEPGSPAPSERELVQHFGVARMTVRQALDALVTEGLLERIPGRGTFVARARIDVQVRLSSYTEEMERRGMKPAARTLLGRLEYAGPGVLQSPQEGPGRGLHPPPLHLLGVAGQADLDVDPGAGDEGSASRDPLEEPFGDQGVQRLSHRHPGDPEVLHELALGGCRTAGLSAVDQASNVLTDLHVLEQWLSSAVWGDHFTHGTSPAARGPYPRPVQPGRCHG